MKHAKIKYTYMRYIAELFGSKIFLTRKFNTRIIFTVKISRSTVVYMLYQNSLHKIEL